MSAIVAQGVGKKYRLGAQREAHSSLKESVSGFLPSWKRRSSARAVRGSPDFWALRDIEFKVQRGEVLGLIGRNGAGKSTLLKLLGEITAPTEGKIFMRGRVASLLEVGTGFHPELSGRENIFLNGAILGMSRSEIERKFDEIVHFSGVEGFVDTPVKRYSSGMYLRLAFAVAANLESEILLVDEVLAVGDAEFQKKCLGKLGDVTHEGRTVVFVSHNMNAVERLCGRALLLSEGRIVELSADVSGVISRYLETSVGSSGSAEWVNELEERSDRWVRPLRFFLGDGKGVARQMPVGNETDMWLYFEFEVLIEDAALTVGYAIYSEDDILLYWSYPSDGPMQSWPDMRKGRHVLRTRIPSRFLNEGTYRVEFLASLHFQEWLLEPRASAPSITLNIRGGLSESPYWMMKRPGILAPVMQWETL